VRFVDTNVLLYAVSKDPAEQDKAARALAILDSRDLALSVQVLQEFYFQATRDGRSHPLTQQQAVGLVESFLRFPVHVMDLALARAAFDARVRYAISYWDAAILEAARALGCSVVLSEDLSDGRDYGGIQVQNPFL
jgi:predicted nucleic acid-binding protein